MKSLAIVVLFISILESSDSVLPSDKQYYKYNENNVEIIYPEEHLDFAKHTASIETPMHKDYEKFFDWKLDETLYVGLISSHNQIANGFSTQLPNNRQINYIGGTKLVDYFTVTSWLDTLLYHETAHNYQINVKDNIVSKSLHSVLGNGNLGVANIFIPLWIVPNHLQNSFMLEGNSVLHESWHGNGGRLYSGRLKVQTILQAASGNITAGDVYNQKLAFPYREIHYIQGGFYNLYMAEKYGIKEITSYFKYYSEHFIMPLFTNSSMKAAVGINFENSLNDFAKEYSSMLKHLKFADGKAIASSQSFTSLSNNSDEIFFLTNETAVRAPELVVIDKKTKEVSKTRDSYLSGKVIKVGEEYLTQSGFQTSLTTIHQGLFDSEAVIKEDTESKIVQGYLSDDRAVYFDVPSSFSQPQLYVGDEFYAQVNSSVIIDKDDNLYYFKQDEKTRTLYKNKTPLYSYQGFYGIVSDVDSMGAIYFIANTKYGSTLYRFSEGEVTQAHSADNVIEVRLVNDNEVLISAISEKDYYYVINDLTTIENEPFETKLFFEDKDYYGEYKESKTAKEDYAHVDLSKPYIPLFDMHYSGSELNTLYTDKNIFGNINIKFSDPLTQNSASVFANTDEENFTLLGTSYTNSEYILNYSALIYKVTNDSQLTKARDAGIVLSTNLPFYKQGRNNAFFSASYYQDPQIKDRDPISTSLTFYNSEFYGVSMYSNYLNMLSLYGSYEDDNQIYGFKYNLKFDLPYQFYVDFGAKHSQSFSDTKGVIIEGSTFEEDSDPTTIQLTSLDRGYYVNSASYADITVKKVFNFSTYYFTFPLSLQRESLYAKFRHYKLEDTNENKYDISEYTIGTTLSVVFLNNAVLPLNIEYIKNDASFIDDENKIRIFTDISF